LNWNYETLIRLLKQIVGRRNAVSKARTNTIASAVVLNYSKERNIPTRSNYFREVEEIINFPQFDRTVNTQKINTEDVQLSLEVMDQLYTYISCIAEMYRDNAFHNFEHASHVLMSVTKLMSRIVSPAHLDVDSPESLHDQSFGITSDPLTQFACAFSALIHDVDHTGVPNAQLIKEDNEIAGYYNNRSVAEQNSLGVYYCSVLVNTFRYVFGFTHS
jgi:hypothetical protein